MEDSNILYPNKVKPVSENLPLPTLQQRLQILATSLQNLGQEEGNDQKYTPLAIHLSDDCFINHSSKEIQLLIACCIADLLRIFAPDAPYKDQKQIKDIFVFFTRQLNGLKDVKDPLFTRYFYLLENLAYVKSYNMCFDISDNQEVFIELFNLFFRILSEEHNSKITQKVAEMLQPLLTESDTVSFELLDSILINIVDPNKSNKKFAHNLSKILIQKAATSLEQYIQPFITQALVIDKPEKIYATTSKIFDLIYELYLLSPSLLNPVLPELECKLKSSSESDRLKSVTLLSKMFSEKDSELAEEHPQLWKLFMGRFNDISNGVRLRCVQSSINFLLHHENLRPQIIENLKNRQHDSDETVRYEVVMTIVEAVKRDFSIISNSPVILDFVKERTLDKVFKIRKEALTGLAIVYKKYMTSVQNKEEVDPVLKQAADWIKNKILHGYYMTQIEDRILVERLLITHLIPYQLPTEERMKVLFNLLATIDENATKAFIELQKSQLKIRKMIGDWVRLHKQKELSTTQKKDIATRCTNISKLLPDPPKAQEYLLKFSVHLRKDSQLLREMEIILRKDVSCKECSDTITQVLKKLGQPVLTNQYFSTIKIVLNRVASLIIDKIGVEVLIKIIEKYLEDDCNQKDQFMKGKNGNWSEEDEDMENGGKVFAGGDLPTSVAGERGLKLLSVLSYIFSVHFQDKNILHRMVQLLKYDRDYVAPLVLKSLTYLGRYKCLFESYPEIVEELAPICKEYTLSGTTKQAKHAIQCMFINTQAILQQNYNNLPDENEKIQKIDIFQGLVESFNHTLSPSNQHYRTAIVCLGHVAYSLPEKYNIQIKNIISRKIVKELLVQGVPEEREDVPNLDWCEEDELPEETRCRVEGLKAMARWLLGLKKDVLSAQKTFRMLNAFIKQKGDLLEQNRLSTAEKSWLRLSAGKAMLKICEQSGVGDQFTPEQYYNLSQLMNDEVPEVREIFVRKLHKGLSKGIPPKCLSIEFMGYYALGGREKNRKLFQQIKANIEADVVRRREYIKTFAPADPQTSPDYMLAYAVTILAHDSEFKDPTDISELKQIEKCLLLILEPLLAANKEASNVGFFNSILERIKQHKSAYKPCEEIINHKLWVICDVAKNLIKTKVPTADLFDSQIDARIPNEYFLPQSEEFRNNKVYLPNGYLNSNSRSSSPYTITGSSSTSSKTTTLFDTKNSNCDHDEEKDQQNNKRYKLRRKRTSSDSDDNIEKKSNGKRHFKNNVDESQKIPFM